MDYTERLRDLREDNDKDQSEIAKILNCKQSAVSKYENGKLNYKVKILLRFANFTAYLPIMF